MEKIINLLKEMRLKSEQEFIKNSIILYNTKGDRPVPDTTADLDNIINLNRAISVLENEIMSKPQNLS